jgi:DNA adenine methylase
MKSPIPNPKSEMKIKAVAPWFGGKRTLGVDIATEVGPCRSYWTLCCGSMADLFARKPSSHETAVDKHHHLINLARVLQDDRLAPQLYDRLQRTLCSEDLFDRARQFYERHPIVADDAMPSVECAYHFFLVSWIGRGGVSGTKRCNYQMAVRFTPGGGHGGVRFRSATESIPWWHRRLRSVTILRRDIFEAGLLEKIDDVLGTGIYIDPTYLRPTRGSGEYEHEFVDMTDTLFASQDDHQRLADQCRRFEKARIVISYYDHPRLEDMYPGWTKRRLTRQKNLHVQNRRGQGPCEAPEVLMINGPSFGGEKT